jgi:hypothetical protein
MSRHYRPSGGTPLSDSAAAAPTGVIDDEQVVEFVVDRHRRSRA